MSAQNLEDVYELSPLQQYMLFNTLYKPASGLYVEQSVSVLRGALNISAFERAWQKILSRHPVLRTAFFWEGLDKPLQVVLRQVPLPLHYQDWSALSDAKREGRLDAYLESDRLRGFVISEAPLLRLALIRTAEETYYFIRSMHHLLLDRWSVSVVLREAFAIYEANCRGHDLPLPPSRPYRDYISWLQHQDVTAAETFWRLNLADFTSPVTLGRHYPPNTQGDSEAYDSQQLQLGVNSTAELRSWAQKNNFTLNTLVQGVWALILSGLSGKEDIVFGATFSGRPASLPGVESIVGLFMNTLPVRVKVNRDESLLSWLQGIQGGIAELSQYEHTPLADVLRWSALSGGKLLFQSIIVFENIPVDFTTAGRSGDLRMQQVRSSGGRTNYPLTLIVVPRSELSVRIIYDCSRFDPGMISRLQRHFQTLLMTIPHHGTRPLFELLSSAGLVTEELCKDTGAPLEESQPPKNETGSHAKSELTTQPIKFFNNVEHRLLEICRKVLGIESVSTTDNLLGLGLRSLQIAQLLAEIETRFGRSLPFSSIFSSATIEGLAALISGSVTPDRSSSIIPIQPHGSKRPFFCIHELFGDIYCYMNLARHLGDGQPFYALQARGLHDTDEPFTDIAEMATHYIDAIRAVQPHGPYALGGLCFGGVVAFEMAQQLRLKGEEVSLVALLDSGVNSSRGKIAWWTTFLCNLFGDLPSWVIGASQLNRAQWAALIKQKVRMTGANLRHAFYLSRNGTPHDSVPVHVQELGELFRFSNQQRKVARAQYWAFKEYRPQVYPGRLTLFRARMQPILSSHAPDKGWRKLAAGGLDIHVIPGNHLGMLQEPHVRVLAQQLKACLEMQPSTINTGADGPPAEEPVPSPL